jgi:hypothetical protein
MLTERGGLSGTVLEASKKSLPRPNPATDPRNAEGGKTRRIGVSPGECLGKQTPKSPSESQGRRPIASRVAFLRPSPGGADALPMR